VEQVWLQTLRTSTHLCPPSLLHQLPGILLHCQHVLQQLFGWQPLALLHHVLDSVSRLQLVEGQLNPQPGSPLLYLGGTEARLVVWLLGACPSVYTQPCYQVTWSKWFLTSC
jgi:hypothetical protein